VLPSLASFATDQLWFQEIKFEPVFLISLSWRGTLFLLGAIIAFAFFNGNLWAARRSTSPVRILHHGEIAPANPLGVLLPKVLFGAAVVGALVVALAASASWMTFLMAFRGVSVGTTDAVFGRDLGFYLFRLPALSVALTTLVAMTVMALIGVVVLYVSRGAATISGGRFSIEPGAARHVGALIALFFVLTAVELWIVDSAGLLYSTTSPASSAPATRTSTSDFPVFVSRRSWRSSPPDW